MVDAVNPSGRLNAEVVRPYINGDDIVQRGRNVWIIDFAAMQMEEAALYELPFEYVEHHVRPERLKNNRQNRRERWWQHGETGIGMRRAIANLSQWILTPQVSKHRVFVWYPTNVLPALVIAFAREDDYFFGVLHSRLHELWSLQMGTSLEDRPRYTPTTTFETFPFPVVPGQEDFSDPRVVTISVAAKTLHEERHAWQNPPQGTPRANERTLTNLYNALQAERGTGTRTGIKAAAAEFAPRLNELHRTLDEAVCAAYSWDAAILSDDEAILGNLLALNQARSS